MGLFSGSRNLGPEFYDVGPVIESVLNNIQKERERKQRKLNIQNLKNKIMILEHDLKRTTSDLKEAVSIIGQLAAEAEALS